ncbi:uncharacterized protein SPPG_08826 [Spizellomyces punctatus DAOM BR117]|uniref:Transmembrane protein n=1 Tax=Spizellomyces punctatus (strain DAOM BR117) TaxID=645134 RepID=A0A0L0HUK5_SPIPD|nr:uncharacterized protein SPPG_08826 [Spizellomyces punctatus DAOM BR117]KND04554.1 hypothetical protein SPPG_08826 [Spizellomyces punctatus DAOM BR117]|eukprot:XP_016612593.1 hypothetical protein SPPG_08826 [Spizellomyces punctatus DAOM BR117]
MSYPRRFDVLFFTAPLHIVRKIDATFLFVLPMRFTKDSGVSLVLLDSWLPYSCIRFPFIRIVLLTSLFFRFVVLLYASYCFRRSEQSTSTDALSGKDRPLQPKLQPKFFHQKLSTKVQV